MTESWHKRLPMLKPRLESLEADDLRLLLILMACYWSTGRIEGNIEGRTYQIEQEQNTEENING